MTELNGTAPPAPQQQQIYAHPDAIQSVRNQRMAQLRRQLEEAEQTADAITAAYLTAQGTQVSLAAQNSQLQAENMKLRAAAKEVGIDLEALGISPEPQPAPEAASGDTPSP